MDWLQEELTQNNETAVIFSHQSLTNDFRRRGVANRLEVQKIIYTAAESGKKIPLCINGHDHTDCIEKINETHYFTLNSMSSKWLGPDYEHFDYPPLMHQQYPHLKDIVVYSKPLFAVVTITSEGAVHNRELDK